MKFKFLLIVFLIIIIKSQSQNFNGGIIGGINATQISGDRLVGYNKLGMNLGAFVNLSTGKFSTLQMELDFVQKGSRSQFGISDTTIESRKIYRLRLNYAEIPILFKYSLRGISKYGNDSTYHLLNKLTVEIGLAYAVLIHSSEEDFTGNYVIYTPPFYKADVSVIGGLYYTINDNLKVSFRRSGSIIPVRKHSGGGTYRLNRGQYNNLIALTLHYQFNKSSSK